MRRRGKARPGRGRKLVGEAKKPEGLHIPIVLIRGHYSLTSQKTSTPRAYFMVKAMLGKTQQGKKEVRALATSQAEQES